MSEERLLLLSRKLNVSGGCPEEYALLAGLLLETGHQNHRREAQNILRERVIQQGHTTPLVEAHYIESEGLWLWETDTDFEYYNIPIFNELQNITIRKSLLDGGRERTQQDWFTHLKDKPERLPTAPELMSIILATHTLRDVEVLRTQIQHAHTFLSNPERRWRSYTSTTVFYRPDEETDLIYYNKNNPAEQPTPALIRGSDEPITEHHANLLEKLVGTRNTQQIIAAGQWLRNNTFLESYLWRINPSEPIERAVVLGVNNDGRFVINANDYIDYYRPALGVVKDKTKIFP